MAVILADDILNCEDSDSNFTEISFQESNWQYASIGSGNGLVLNRRQAITWTDDDSVYRRIYAALGGNLSKRRWYRKC